MRRILLAAMIASGSFLSTVPSAQADCGIECWLSNTFSTNDGVGDWLRETFGGYANQGGDDKNPRLGKNIARANEIAASWKPGKNYLNREDAAGLKPSCKLPDLVSVVIKTKSPEATLKSCFRGK